MTTERRAESGSPGTASTTTEATSTPRYAREGLAWQIARGVIPLIVVGIGIAVALRLIATRPKTEREGADGPAEALVEVVEVRREAVPVTIHAMGTVVPAREIDLQARVSGEVIEMHPLFVPGGFLDRGVELVRLEPRDYEAQVAQRAADLARAEAAVALEQGRRDVAAREWELVQRGRGESSDENRGLALREPQRKESEAALTSAQAALELAELNLERTRVKAPFNCMARAREVNLGSVVQPQTRIARLVGTDEYWVQALVPVDRVGRIRIPRRVGDEGSAARVMYRADDGDAECAGRVFRLLPDLEETGRMARVLITIPDPLGLRADGEAKSPIVLGSFVRVEIEGESMPDCVRLPRRALRDDDTVWVAAADGTLRIEPVEVVWREPETVLLRARSDDASSDGASSDDGGLDGARIVVSTIGAPVEGMPLRTAADAAPAAPAAPADEEDGVDAEDGEEVSP